MMPVVGAGEVRPFRLGCFDARSGLLVAADESLPLAAEIDCRSGAVTRVLSWPVAPGLRDRPVALDVLVTGEAVLIASPAAGGVIRFDHHQGDHTLISLDADAGALTACGDAVWAVARPDWCHTGPGEPPAGGGRRTRPVAWEGPTAAEIAREEDRRRRRRRAGRADSPAAGRGWSVAERRRAEGDTVTTDPPTPVWRIRGDTARRIDADLQGPRLAAVAGTIAGVGQLPGDPLVKHVDAGHSVSYRSPGSVIMLDGDGTVTRAGPVADTGGLICEDHGRAWLLGFDDTGDTGTGPVRELILPGGRITDPLGIRVENPAGVVSGLVADLCWRAPPSDPYGFATWREAVLRFLPVDGSDPAEVALPGLQPDARAKVADGQVWISSRGEDALTVVTPGHPAPRELAISLDCRPWIPAPQPPSGLDLREFEDRQLARFRAELHSATSSPPDRHTPLLPGVTIDVTEVRGTFPGTELTALFRSADRPGVQFGRRRRLYDELGNPIPRQWAHVYLAEDIAGGLPSPAECHPDGTGTTWI